MWSIGYIIIWIQLEQHHVLLLHCATANVSSMILSRKYYNNQRPRSMRRLTVHYKVCMILIDWCPRRNSGKYVPET
jgi:hypothetical protein